MVRLVEQAAARRHLMVTLLCDANHLLHSDYSQVRTIAPGADAVDIALVNLCREGDVVVTQDHGVAAMALGKGARAIHPSGMRYTDENIDRLLMERHLAKKARLGHARMGRGKHHLKGPARRTSEDDRRFAQAFDALLDHA